MTSVIRTRDFPQHDHNAASVATVLGRLQRWYTNTLAQQELLNLDSSLGARKQLAQELGYTGALDGSAEMNVWLHKQVMVKLAEGGGKVPDSLKT